MKQGTRKYAPGQAPRERIITAARRLFSLRGFHATTTAQLATEASVSMGQIYRHFTSKDDIILAIAEEDVDARVSGMAEIFEAVERGERTIFEAIKAIAAVSLENADAPLFYEMLAEAYRNCVVAERLDMMSDSYRAGVGRLAALARPDVPRTELDAYVDIMMACFLGLGHRRSLTPSVDMEQMSHSTAHLLLRALGLREPA